MTIYILGAGPTGLAIADGIVDAGTDSCVLLERGSRIGGLAQTVEWGDGAHDLGPHKIFSLDERLVTRIENLLPPKDWLTRTKVSSIYMNGHYLPYPPSPFSLAGVFGIPAFIKMVMGYGSAKVSSIFNTKQPTTFAEDLERRMGGPLYEVLFKPMAEKLWGDPRTLDVKLSKGRVQTPSLIEVFGRLLKIKSNSKFEALTFRYPKGGLGRIWDAIAAKSHNRVTIKTGANIIGLVSNGSRVTQISYQVDGINSEISVGLDDFVVSTLPLTHTVQLLSSSLPPGIQGIADKVAKLNDLLLVFLRVDCTSLIDESWVFIPDPDIIFHRLSEQESFDPNMTPKGSIVCCEIMSSLQRPMNEKSNEELISLSLKGLADMGYKNFKVMDAKVVRLSKSYPVFCTGYEEGLSELIAALDSFDNFRSIGRQGAFNYIGTLDAMDIGYGFVNWLSNRNKANWTAERARTSHYPVLD